MSLSKRACRTILAVHIFDNEPFSLKYQSIFKLLFVCSYVTAMILKPFWLYSLAHQGAFVPFQNCLHIIKLWAGSGHCIAMSLQYSKSRKQQAPQFGSWYEIHVL